MQLVPHLLVRSESAASQAAMLLREAGYMVTKVTDDETATCYAAMLDVDGVVVDLPALAAVNAVRRLQEVPAFSSPVLVISRSPDVIRRCTGAGVLHPQELEVDLVSTVDLMLAAGERLVMQG